MGNIGHTQPASRYQGRLLASLTRDIVRFAALVAIALQVLVVQTHLHASAAPPADVSMEGPDGDAAFELQEGAGEANAVCVICQAQAQGRFALAAGSADVCMEPSSVCAPPPAIRQVPTPPAHNWQSRAPPIVF